MDFEKVEPATPFMEGYTRSPEMTEKLVAALRAALYANPTMRFGQLLENARRDAMYGDLFNFYDENFIETLNALSKPNNQ